VCGWTAFRCHSRSRALRSTRFPFTLCGNHFEAVTLRLPCGLFLHQQYGLLGFLSQCVGDYVTFIGAPIVPKFVRKILFAIMLIVSTTAFARADSLNAGLTAFRRGDYVRTANLLGPLALRGNARAQAMLGYLYANGLGTPQSYFAAVDLYTNAAERGNPTAQYLLGLCTIRGWA
jgi:hypothetical protein